MLQLQRNYTSEWIFHFYYSDMFSDEYMHLQQVQEQSESIDTRYPNNTEALNAFLDVRNKMWMCRTHANSTQLDRNEKQGLLHVIQQHSEMESNAAECSKVNNFRSLSKIFIGFRF